jgi:hypothetical protein
MNGEPIDPKKMYRGLGRFYHFFDKRGAAKTNKGSARPKNLKKIGQFNTIVKE